MMQIKRNLTSSIGNATATNVGVLTDVDDDETYEANLNKSRRIGTIISHFLNIPDDTLCQYVKFTYIRRHMKSWTPYHYLSCVQFWSCVCSDISLDLSCINRNRTKYVTEIIFEIFKNDFT